MIMRKRSTWKVMMHIAIVGVAIAVFASSGTLAQGGGGDPKEDTLKVKSVLRYAAEAYEVLKVQEGHDRESKAELSHQCNEMESTLKKIIDSRLSTIGTVQSLRDEAVQKFKNKMAEHQREGQQGIGGKAVAQSLFSSIITSLEGVNAETHKSKVAWERFRKDTKDAFESASDDVRDLIADITPLQSIDEELSTKAGAVVQKVAASLDDLKDSFQTPTPEGQFDESVGSTAEFVRGSEESVLETFRKASLDHENALKDSIEALRNALTKLQVSCKSMEKAYGTRAHVSSTLSTAIAGAVKAHAPDVFDKDFQDSFDEYISRAVDLEVTRTEGNLDGVVSTPMSTSQELAGLEPRVVQHAITLRRRANQHIVDAADAVVVAKQEVEDRQTAKENALEVLKKTEDLVADAMEDFMDVTGTTYETFEDVADINGVTGLDGGMTGAEGTDFSAVSPDDHGDLLSGALKHQVSVFEVNALRKRVKSLQNDQEREANLVEESGEAVAHAQKALEAAEAALKLKKKIWAKTQDAAEEVLRMLGRVVGPIGPIAEDPEAIAREREQVRAENEELEKQVRTMQEDGRDLLSDLDVASNHYDSLDDSDATGGIDMDNDATGATGISDVLDDMFGSYSRLRKGRDEKEEIARATEDMSDRALRSLSEYLVDFTGDDEPAE